MHSRSLTSTAYHEAGHAAAAWHLGRAVRWASIVETEDYLGSIRKYRQPSHKRVEYDDSPKLVAQIENSILICYAGPLAQRRKFPRSRWRLSGSRDFEQAADLFTHICDADQKSQYHHSALLWRRAELLVKLLEPEIARLAAELLRASTLKWSDIQRVLQKVR